MLLLLEIVLECSIVARGAQNVPISVFLDA
jgi:hypothetical protein